MQCPVCQKELRLIAVIKDPAVIEKILRYLKLWCGPARFAPARPPPSAELREPEPEFLVLVESGPMLDYNNSSIDRQDGWVDRKLTIPATALKRFYYIR